MLSAVPAEAQTPSQALSEKSSRFIRYAEDFNSFAQSGAGSADEYEVAASLGSTAFEAVEELRASLGLLDIYDALSCPEDRAKVRPMIESRLSYYSKSVAVSVKQANLNIAHTQKPGIAAEATRMRDDLRETQTILDSIKLE